MVTLAIFGGGTGGHLYPALHLAMEAKSNGLCQRVVLLGTGKQIEKTIVERYHLDAYLALEVKPLKGRGIGQKMAAIFGLFLSLPKAWNWIKQEKVSLGISVGGYAAASGTIAAWFRGKPIVMLEQNSRMGFTNRMLKPLVKAIWWGLPPEKPGKGIVLGNPVRVHFDQKHDTNTDDTVVVGILGGSQGARFLNTKMPELFDPQEKNIKVIHQSGSGREKEVVNYPASINLEIVPFIADMQDFYQQLDLIICRSGAMTVSEVAAMGVVAIFVPLPSAADDHQMVNAQAACSNGKGWILNENFSQQNQHDILQQALTFIRENKKKCPYGKNLLWSDPKPYIKLIREWVK